MHVVRHDRKRVESVKIPVKPVEILGYLLSYSRILHPHRTDGGAVEDFFRFFEPVAIQLFKVGKPLGVSHCWIVCNDSLNSPQLIFEPLSFGFIETDV
jgi:hypothetical protein